MVPFRAINGGWRGLHGKRDNCSGNKGSSLVSQLHLVAKLNLYFVSSASDFEIRIAEETMAYMAEFKSKTLILKTIHEDLCWL